LVAAVIHKCVYTVRYVYIHTLFTREDGQAKEIKKKCTTTLNAACQGILSKCNFGYACHRFASPGLEESVSMNIKVQDE